MATSQLQDARLISEATLKTMLYAETLLVVNETLSLVPNTPQNYSIATLLGTEASKYLMSTVQVDVFVLDSETGSPTNGFYVDASALVSVGIKTNGSVVLVNYDTTALSVLVRIRVSKKQPT